MIDISSEIGQDEQETSLFRMPRMPKLPRLPRLPKLPMFPKWRAQVALEPWQRIALAAKDELESQDPIALRVHHTYLPTKDGLKRVALVSDENDSSLFLRKLARGLNKVRKFASPARWLFHSGKAHAPGIPGAPPTVRNKDFKPKLSLSALESMELDQEPFEDARLIRIQWGSKGWRIG